MEISAAPAFFAALMCFVEALRERSFFSPRPAASGGASALVASLRFRRPAYIGDTVTARATVAEKIDRGNRVVLKIECIVDGKRVIAGDAEVVAPSREA